MINSSERAEALRQSFNFDHRFRHKQRIWKPRNQERLATEFLDSWLPDLFIVFEIYFTFEK
jgi:hypothetical protein